MITKYSPECSFAIGSKPGTRPSKILDNIIEEDGEVCGFTAADCDELLSQGLLLVYPFLTHFSLFCSLFFRLIFFELMCVIFFLSDYFRWNSFCGMLPDSNIKVYIVAGVKPWDNDAADVLGVLNGDWAECS